GSRAVMRSGNGRQDVYYGQLDGTWSGPGLLRSLKQNVDLSYTLTFPDTGKWNFQPLDGSPAAGKIATIVDRNGHTITLRYDGIGRLVTIHDALDTPSQNRDVAVAYNADGYISSVTDFNGRQVQYAYYHAGDAGGSAGDLKSVTSPPIIGTPNGN